MTQYIYPARGCNDIEILLEKWFSSEYLPEIHSLINDFDLTPVTEEWLI